MKIAGPRPRYFMELWVIGFWRQRVPQLLPCSDQTIYLCWLECTLGGLDRAYQGITSEHRHGKRPYVPRLVMARQSAPEQSQLPSK